VAGQRRDYIAAVDAVSGQPHPWNPRADDAVNALAVSGSTVYAGGLFTRIGGSRRDYLAALDAEGAATSWNPGAVSTAARSERGVRALAVSSACVYAGGAFTAMGGERRKNIAAIDTASGLATAWNPGTDKVVWALALSGSRLYVGGSFARLGGRARSRLGAVDVDRGTTLPWNPRAGGAEADVRSLAVLGQTLYAGGWFTSMGGYRRNHLAAVSAGSGLVTSWRTPWAVGRIDALAVSGGRLWAGETLRTGKSIPKPYLARFSQAGL
jgi:trimeric autotransporter adhesin